MTSIRRLILSLLLIALPACSATIPTQRQSLAPEISTGGIDHQIYCQTTEVNSDLGSRRTEWRTEIDAPPQAVWAVLTDYENYPNLIPSATYYKIIERNGNTLIIDTRGKSTIKIQGRARYVEDPQNFIIKWEKIKSNVNLNSGYWELTPFEREGRIATAVFHYVYTSPNIIERAGNLTAHLEEDEIAMLRKIQQISEKQ